MSEENTSVVPQEQKPVYPRQNVAGSEHDVHEPFTLQTEVHLWELMSERSVAASLNRLEQQELQLRSTMERIEANGGKGNQDWKQLETKHADAVRQLEHFKKTVQPGDIIYKAKTIGFASIHVGCDWNRSLQRHVVVNELGKVVRVLSRSPV